MIMRFGWKQRLYNWRHMYLPFGLTRILARAIPGSRYRITGNSMAPTLRDGQQVLAADTTLGDGSLPRGAVVVLRHPVSPNDIYIKRIVGLPGENLRIDGGRVYLDDELLPESYLAPAPSTNATSPPGRVTARLWILEADEYFVMGDRRDDSQDSRSFGPVHHNLILGRVWLRYWPPQAWGPLSHR